MNDFAEDAEADPFDELDRALSIAVRRAGEMDAPVEYVNLLVQALAQLRAPLSREAAIATARNALRRWRLWSGER